MVDSLCRARRAVVGSKLNLAKAWSSAAAMTQYENKQRGMARSCVDFEGALYGPVCIRGWGASPHCRLGALPVHLRRKLACLTAHAGDPGKSWGKRHTNDFGSAIICSREPITFIATRTYMLV